MVPPQNISTILSSVAAGVPPAVKGGVRRTSLESQRDSVPKPGVGPRRGPTPGRVPAKSSTPPGLRWAGATPVGLVERRDLSRGSSFLATPGFGSQSRWDWKPPMLPPRFMTREPVDFEQGASHEPRVCSGGRPACHRGRDGPSGPPLPPNRTGGFPASGSPVDESSIQPRGFGTRLVHLAQVEAFREINPSSVKKALGYLL